MPSDRVAEVDRLVAYHGTVARALTSQRSSVASSLIPVEAYILVAASEAWFRHPTLVRAIDDALPAEQIGHAARHPGRRVNAVHLWSLVNVYLTGRKALLMLQRAGLPLDVVDDPERTWTMLDFWRRAAHAYRGDDGTLQAWDADQVNRPYDDTIVGKLLASAVALDGHGQRAELRRFLATLASYSFLVNLETRIGVADTGPYDLPDGRTLLVRDFYSLARGDLPWSDVTQSLRYDNLTVGLVLDGVQVRCDDWGTSTTDPVDYLPHVVAVSLHATGTSASGTGSNDHLDVVPHAEMTDLCSAVSDVQAQVYRRIAELPVDTRLDVGSSIYFSLLRPFADLAGIGDQLDWTVPRATVGPLYDVLSSFRWSDGLPDDPSAPYYPPLQQP